MNTRISWLALALVTIGANASAATVTFTLDLTGPAGTFKLTASDSLDNGGIVSYGIPLTGSFLWLDHYSPYVVSSRNFAPVGFAILRSADGIPNIFAAQPLTGPAENYLYGIGQIANSFHALGIPIAGNPEVPFNWDSPVVVAQGGYDPAMGLPGFDTNSSDLFSNVFESAGNSFPRISAQIVTRVLLIPEPGTYALVVAAVLILSGRRK